MAITTLLFDVGDVLIDIDWQRGYRKMLGQMKDEAGRDLTMEEITEQLHPGPYGSVWDAICHGTMSHEDFVTQAIHHTGYKGDPDLLVRSLTELFEPLTHRIELLNQLITTTDYTVALVSDTCDMHMSHIENYIPTIFKSIPLERRFYSHRMGVMKKNGVAIYSNVLAALGVKPENALMIDDRIDNKIGADAIGLNFLCIQKNDDLAAALQARPYEIKF